MILDKILDVLKALMNASPGQKFMVTGEEQIESIKGIITWERRNKGYTTLEFSDDYKSVKKLDMSWLPEFEKMEKNFNQ